MPYGSLAGYITFQKKVIKLAIPLLAKAKLTVGAGVNNQTYKSVPTQSDLETLIPGLESSSTAPTADALIKFVKDNTNSVTGFHIQTGLQFKLLMLVYLRSSTHRLRLEARMAAVVIVCVVV